MSSDWKVKKKLQLNLAHSAEVIVEAQASIYFLNSKMGDVKEDHSTSWLDMWDIMKKLILHGSVLEDLDVDVIMK